MDLPVTVDLAGGYGEAGATGRRAVAAGVVGGNLEDQIKPLEEAVATVEAVLAAGREAGTSSCPVGWRGTRSAPWSPRWARSGSR